MKRRAAELQQALPLPTGGDTREAYSRIRNFLAGRLVGATRDEGLPRALLNLPRSGGEWINTYAASC